MDTFYNIIQTILADPIWSAAILAAVTAVVYGAVKLGRKYWAALNHEIDLTQIKVIYSLAWIVVTSLRQEMGIPSDDNPGEAIKAAALAWMIEQAKARKIPATDAFLSAAIESAYLGLKAGFTDPVSAGVIPDPNALPSIQ